MGVNKEGRKEEDYQDSADGGKRMRVGCADSKGNLE
jgi:hypothetical protein